MISYQAVLGKKSCEYVALNILGVLIDAAWHRTSGRILHLSFICGIKIINKFEADLSCKCLAQGHAQGQTAATPVSYQGDMLVWLICQVVVKTMMSW